MRKVLTSCLFALALATGVAAQESKVDTAVDKTKAAGQEVGDKAEDVKDQTVKGAKKVGSATKKGVNEVGDKAEDVGDATAKGAKKTGNWFKRTWRKIF